MPASIALQLYTLRDALADDFTGTLAAVAAQGYTAVETAFFPETISFDVARAALDSAGLTVCSVHADLPTLENEEQVIAQAAALGGTTLVWHGWPEDPRYLSLDGIADLIADYNAATAIARDHGLRLALHNHWWEFRPVAGVVPFDLLIADTDPDLCFELDLYWATVAGVDPATLLQRLGPRASLIHVKDGPANPDGLKTPLGAGTLPLPQLLAAAQNAAWWIVELDDCATAMLDATAESLRYLQSLSATSARPSA